MTYLRLLAKIPGARALVDLITREDSLNIRVTALQQEFEAFQKGATNTEAALKEFNANTMQHRELLGEHLSTIDVRLSKLIGRNEELGHQLALFERAETKTPSKKQSAQETRLADDHTLDDFYLQFENRFRGDQATIKERQKLYLPYIKAAHSVVDDITSVLDIGCGRGEFLELIQDIGLTPIGLDLNLSMVDEIIKKGMQATQMDAYDFLLTQKSNSLLAVTGFQIVEHIPFNELVRILTECFRVLAPGGIIIFETPNPENLVVSGHTFRYDPSHLNPLPPNLLSFVVETRGFDKIEIVRLHPVENSHKQSKDVLLEELATLIYGPRDYSVIATKPF